MENDDLITAYLAGKSVGAIGKDCGKTAWYVKCRLKECGIPLRTPSKAYTLRRAEIPLERIIELRKQGLTHKAIAESVGCHVGTVSTRLRESGNNTQIPKPRMTIDIGEVVRLRAEGHLFPEIAASMNCSDATLRKRCRAAGLPRHLPMKFDLSIARQMRSNGLSYAKIANCLRTSPGLIRHHIRKAGQS